MCGYFRIPVGEGGVPVARGAAAEAVYVSVTAGVNPAAVPVKLGGVGVGNAKKRAAG